MSNETEIQEIEVKAVKAATVLAIETALETLRKEMQVLNAKRQSNLPPLALEERKVLEEHALAIGVSEDENTKASELRKDRRLSDEDKDQIAMAKLKHRESANSAAGKQSAAFHVAKARLTSFKLVHRKDGRVDVRISGQC